LHPHHTRSPLLLLLLQGSDGECRMLSCLCCEASSKGPASQHQQPTNVIRNNQTWGHIRLLLLYLVLLLLLP
jgi:hypothetical protein